MAGPYEFVLIEFTENPLSSDMVAALIDLVEFKTIRILDIVFIEKSETGSVTWLEIDELSDDLKEPLYDLDGEYDGLVSDEDIRAVGAGLAAGSSALAVIWENTWAGRFVESVRSAGGVVVALERLPQSEVEAALLAVANADN